MIRAAFVVLMAAQWFGGGERNTREGAEHFEAGRLEEALRAFSRAEGEFPDAPENDLNIAGVHYRLGEAEGAPAGEEGPLAEALRGYQAALQGGAGGAVRRDAFYNLANTLFRGGAFREAAAAYGEAIALDPDDREARQNLERALRAADEEERQGESQDQEQQDQQQQEQDPQPRDQEGQEQQSPQEQGQDPQDSPSSGDRDQESGQEPQPPPPDGSPQSQDQPPADDTSGSAPEDAGPGAETPDSAPGEVPEISPEQAERILAALADVERAFQEDRLEKRRARALRRGRH
ncbi:MAG: tetratricopeptide repeat protein [Acidobacteriota bacterium]|nr:tetratricopeptide repeat protein [Acidobacteriota bacterium]